MSQSMICREGLCHCPGTIFLSVLDLKQSAQNAPQGLGRFPDYDVHTHYSFLPLAAGKTAGDQHTGNQKHQHPHRENRRNQNSNAQRHRENADEPAVPRSPIAHTSRPLSDSCNPCAARRKSADSNHRQGLPLWSPFHCADYHSISAEAVPGAETKKETPDNDCPAFLLKIHYAISFAQYIGFYFFPFCTCHS